MLLLTIGLTSVAMLAVSVLASIVSFISVQRQVQLAADAAALAAANQIDASVFYESGRWQDLALSPAAARQAALAALGQSSVGPTLTSITLVSKQVWLSVELQWQAPIGFGSHLIRAESSADLVVR